MFSLPSIPTKIWDTVDVDRLAISPKLDLSRTKQTGTKMICSQSPVTISIHALQ